MSTTIKRPSEGESSSYFKGYINQVESDDFLQVLKDGKKEPLALFKTYLNPIIYKEKKWTMQLLKVLNIFLIYITNIVHQIFLPHLSALLLQLYLHFSPLLYMLYQIKLIGIKCSSV